MKQNPWQAIRSVLAVVGLGAPLLPLGLTRYRLEAAAAVLLLGALALYLRNRRPRAYTALVGFYLALCIALLARTRELIESACGDVWIRAGGTAVALIALHLGARALFERNERVRRWRQSKLGELLLDAAAVAATIVVLRLGQWGRWPNPAWVSGTFLALPLIHFKPRRVVLAIWAACAVIVVFEWHGYMTTRYLHKTPTNLPPGVAVTMLRHGEPDASQGARFYQSGVCDATAGAVYMGEMRRTYRLNPDGREVNLVEAERGRDAEALCTLIELCERNVIVTGSYEARFIRFADLLTGKAIQDLPLKGMPTFLALSPDRRYVYASTIRPAGIVRIDLETRAVDRELSRFYELDAAFSGVSNLVLQNGRIFAAYSSYFTLDNRPGEVFSVDLDLGDYRPLHRFTGSWGAVAPTGGEDVYFKAYSKPDLYRVAANGSGAALVAKVPAGYYYLARLAGPGIIVTNHWATGEFLAMCENDFNRRYRLDFGGMGRPLTVVGDKVMTAVPAGYATISLSDSLCR